MDIITASILGLLGVMFGSFAGASVWRLRARQLVDDKKNGEPVDSTEYALLKKLTKAKVAQDRSQCLRCSYTLKWYDLIPLVSWIGLKGRCRDCHKRIGYFEPLIELGVGAFFVMSYVMWPQPLVSALDITQFVLWLAAGVGLAVLFAYDAKWFLLPSKVNHAVIGIGVISSFIAIAQAPDTLAATLNVAASVGILSGTYGLIYAVSKGRMIGFGDVILGLGLGLLLADWQLAFIALFSANLIGCIIVIPGMVSGKLTRTSHVPFGPLLIAGWAIAGLWGHYLVDFYVSSLL